MGTLTHVSYRFSRETSPMDRLLDSFICAPSGCWEWIRGKHYRGYGQITIYNKHQFAHRAVYELLRGAIPKGKVLDHLCENTSCVNPDHLKVTTQKENVTRGGGITAENKAKTHCKRGHEFNEANTIKIPKGRQCLPCRQILRKQQYWRNK